MTPCPICRGTGIAHSAPHIAGLTQTLTVCACPHGKALAERVARDTGKQA